MSINLVQNSDNTADFIDSTTFNSVLKLGSGVGNFPGIDVRKFGAVGDGVADDTAAIQGAIDEVKRLLDQAIVLSSKGWQPTLYFPSGLYKITNTLNLTAIKAHNFLIEGNNSVLVAAINNKPVLDMLSSANWSMRNIFIWPADGYTPSYGILMGRASSSDEGSSANAHLMDIRIDGTYSRASFYNNGGEQIHAENCVFVNRSSNQDDYAVIMDAAHVDGITSDFVTVDLTQNSDVSFNGVRFTRCEFRKAFGGSGSGSPVLYQGGSSQNIRGHRYDNCYAVSLDKAFVEFDNCRGGFGFYFDVHLETTASTDFMHIDNDTPSNNIVFGDIVIQDYNPQCTNSIIKATGTTRNINFENLTLNLGAPTNTPKVFDSTMAVTKLTVTGRMSWLKSGTIDMDEGVFVGEIATFTSTTITAASESAYKVMRRPSTSANQINNFVGDVKVSDDIYRGDDQVVTARQTGWSAATGTADRTTFATGTVTTEELAERVKAIIDDLTTHGLIGS